MKILMAVTSEEIYQTSNYVHIAYKILLIYNLSSKQFSTFSVADFCFGEKQNYSHCYLSSCKCYSFY